MGIIANELGAPTEGSCTPGLDLNLEKPAELGVVLALKATKAACSRTHFLAAT